MDTDPNYMTIEEMKDLIQILEGLNTVSVAHLYLDEVIVRDSNGDCLGKIGFREPGYVFIPGEFTQAGTDA